MWRVVKLGARHGVFGNQFFMPAAAIRGFERGRQCELPPDAVNGFSLGYLPDLSFWVIPKPHLKPPTWHPPRWKEGCPQSHRGHQLAGPRGWGWLRSRSAPLLVRQWCTESLKLQGPGQLLWFPSLRKWAKNFRGWGGCNKTYILCAH